MLRTDLFYADSISINFSFHTPLQLEEGLNSFVTWFEQSTLIPSEVYHSLIHLQSYKIIYTRVYQNRVLN